MTIQRIFNFHKRPISASESGRHDLDRLMALAGKAGAAAGTAEGDDAYSELVLSETLSDDERERIGFATHMIIRASRAGYSPAELWRYVQMNLQGYPRYSAVKLIALAFSAGLCHNDRQVSSAMRHYLSDMLAADNRSASAVLVPARQS